MKLWGRGRDRPAVFRCEAEEKHPSVIHFNDN